MKRNVVSLAALCLLLGCNGKPPTTNACATRADKKPGGALIKTANAAPNPFPKPTPTPTPAPAVQPKPAPAPGQDQAPPKAASKGPFPQSTHPNLAAPEKATEQAPAKFQVKFDTTVGDIVVDCQRDWAPHGVDRFYNLVKIGFFDDVSFFRAVKGFVVQFGIHGNPDVAAKWKGAKLPADEVKETNRKGTLTFAMARVPTSRTTQMFFNLVDNKRLDGMGFAPVCEISQGIQNLEQIYMDYGGRPSQQQGTIQAQGNKFLREQYPLLDYIKTATLVAGPS